MGENFQQTFVFYICPGLILKLLWKGSGIEFLVLSALHLAICTRLQCYIWTTDANNINQNHSRSKIKCASIHQSLVGLCHSDEVVREYVYSVPDCQDWSSQIPQWGKISPPGWSYPSLSACRVQIQQHCTPIKIQTSASVIPSISENLDWWKTGAENELCTYPTCRSPSRSACSRSMVVILLVSTHLISIFCRLSM